MELDTSTFILELINFVVLVWLLNRFLFKPILNIMNQRQTQINASIDNAAQIQKDAALLRERYESRLDEWEKEKQAAHAQLNGELAIEKEKGLQQTREAISAEQTRLRAQEDKQRMDWQHRIEAQALKQGAIFTSRLLSDLSSESLDASIVKFLIKEIESWPEEKLLALRKAAEDQQGQIQVVSARPLTAQIKNDIEHALNGCLHTVGHFSYSIEPELLSGLRLNVSPWLMRANLGDELDAFIDSGIHHV